MKKREFNESFLKKLQAINDHHATAEYNFIPDDKTRYYQQYSDEINQLKKQYISSKKLVKTYKNGIKLYDYFDKDGKFLFSQHEKDMT